MIGSFLDSLGSALSLPASGLAGPDRSLAKQSSLDSFLSARPLPASGLERAVRDLANHLPGNLGGEGRDEPPAGGPRKVAGGTDKVDLKDMTLPARVLELVGPVLGEFNMRVEVAKKSNRLIKDARMHFAINGGFSVYFLHFKHEVLEDARWANDVMGCGWLFQPGDNVRILSQDCERFDPTYEFAWLTWSDKGIATEYVEWRRIARLAQLDDAERPDLLRADLRLPPTLKRRSSSSAPQDLVDDSARFDALVSLITRMGVASGNADASAVVNNLLIGAVPQEMRAGRTVWGTGYSGAAREILQWLHGKGRHPTRTGYTCLAAVLVNLLDGLGVEDRTLIVETLEQYRLISAADELARIRQKFLEKADE